MTIYHYLFSYNFIHDVIGYKTIDLIDNLYDHLPLFVLFKCSVSYEIKMRKFTTQLSPFIDDCDDNTYIVSLFKTTYNDLYNNVSTHVHNLLSV